MKASLQRWLGRVPDISAVVTRFPIPTAIMAVFTVIIIFDDLFPNEDQMARLLAGLVISGYLCVSYAVGREGQGKSPSIILQVALTLVITTLAWFSESLRLNIFMAMGAVLILLGNAVRLFRDRDDLHVWDYTHKIWTGAGFATLGSIIFVLGILAIQGALQSLFGVDIRGIMENLILPIGLGFLAPLYWLSTIPPADEPYTELYDNPGFVSKAVAFLGTWLLSPLTLIYALILLAYAVKIILAGELPKGEIAGLTTPFLLIGMLTWLVLYPPFIRDKLPAKLFRKSWFLLLVPAAIMLAIAVIVRIGEYGFTPERIALVFCVIWSLGLALWFTFASESKRDIRLIPGLAVLLLTLGAFGADRLSLMNQSNRLVSNLKAAGIMTDAGVVKAQDKISITDENAAAKAKGALVYVHKNRGEVVFKRLFAKSNDPSLNSADTSGDLITRLGLDDVETAGRWVNDFANYNSDTIDIDVSEFDRLIRVNSHMTKRKPYEPVFETATVRVTHRNNLVTVYSTASTKLTEFDLGKAIADTPVVDGKIKLDSSRINILDDGTRKVSIILISAGYNTANPSPENFNLEYYLLTSGF